MRYLVLGMIVLFSLGDGCSPASGVVGVQDYGQVTGRVLDAMTNRPIPSSIVSVGSLFAASADSRGAFVLTRVPAGDQTVTARAPGYSTAGGDVTVLKDRTVSVGYVRLVPLVHAAGQPTLAPPPTPVPEPSPSAAAGATPGAAATSTPAAGTATPPMTATPPPSVVPSALPSIVPSATPSPMSS
jgi:hypothetical protein